MVVICQKCGQKGTIVLEKERDKQKRRSKRSTNEKHKEYESSKRVRGQYYRIYHAYYENGKRIQSFCYIGNVEKFIDNFYHNATTSKSANYIKNQIETLDFNEKNQELADLLWDLKQLGQYRFD